MCNTTQGAEDSLITQGKEFSHEQSVSSRHCNGLRWNRGWFTVKELSSFFVSAVYYTTECIFTDTIDTVAYWTHCPVLHPSQSSPFQTNVWNKCFLLHPTTRPLIYRPVQCSAVPVWCGWDGVCRVLVTRTILVSPSGGALWAVTMAVWGGNHLQNRKQFMKYVQNNWTRNCFPVRTDFYNVKCQL